VQDTPVVRLNRAAAVGERDGPAAGLALVDAIDGLASYPWWHATRAELLHRTGAASEARIAYRHALAVGLSGPASEHLLRRLAELPD
jgi:RNA polymerase sigma-70 factor (ECF subfamily)